MPRRLGQGIELLADPTRRAIIAAIAVGVRRPSEIAARIGLSRPATTRQLHLLEEAGLIRWALNFRDGRGRTYAIDPGAHGPITAWLAGVELDRGPRYRDVGWHHAERVGRREPPGSVGPSGATPRLGAADQAAPTRQHSFRITETIRRSPLRCMRNVLPANPANGRRRRTPGP